MEINQSMDRLLRRWSDVAPEDDFNDKVWRRIRMAADDDQRRHAFWEKGNPAWFRAAMAASLGIAMGIGSAFATSFSPHEEPLLRQDTVAGSYIRLAAGHLQ